MNRAEAKGSAELAAWEMQEAVMQEFGHVWGACFGLSEDTGCHHRACITALLESRGVSLPH